MSGNKKEEILEMLANKEISKEEAERKLQELGDPIQEPEMVQPPPKSNKGCLIAIIIGAVLLPILAVILFILLALFVTVERKSVAEERESMAMEAREKAIEREKTLQERYRKEEALKEKELEERNSK